MIHPLYSTICVCIDNGERRRTQIPVKHERLAKAITISQKALS